MPPPEFRCTIERASEETVVRPAGEIDLEASDPLRRALADVGGRVVVDLSEVTFLDSTGMSAFAVTHKRLASDGGSLTLRAPQPNVRRVLELTGMDIWFEREP